jgi:polysaccharide chain length determinant protein (PEP-CTERM system associated)
LGEQDEGLDVLVNKLLRVAVKRRWWVFVPTVVVGLGACAATRVIPNHYTSVATILVAHQQVPERYVTPNSTADLQEQLMLMRDEILSRTQLLKIIDEFGLYPKARKRLAPEELVEMIRSDINLAPPEKAGEAKDLNSFKISYTGNDPHMAQRVTLELTTLFTQGYEKSREEQSAGTTNFLDEHLQAAAEDLRRQEELQRDFKMKYLGELPEQQQANLANLAGLHAQLQNTMATISHAREQQAFNESLLAQYQNMAAEGIAPPGTVVVSPTEAARQELAKLKNERAGLLARYTDKYPDVVKLDEQIKEAEATLATAQAAPAAPPKGPDPATGETGKDIAKTASSPERDAAIAQLQSQLQANKLEVQDGLKEQKQIESRIAEIQGRLNMTPVREEQLAAILRGYDLSKKNYDDLQSKKTQSELATSLEIRQQGSKFTVIDPPNLPVKPSGLDHMKISLGGLGAGLALGVAVVFLLEAKDHSLIDEKDLSRLFSFPLMVGMPALVTKAEGRRRSRLRMVEWFVGAALCMLVCATEFYVYRRG